ncbi:COG1470 family protein [Streptomyces sp. BBFR102]|uniref:COG1470 family protein n=1 Tax=Streptomyces sp. BBFR102 TaxID=3448171 RepID=UPI003F532AC8
MTTWTSLEPASTTVDPGSSTTVRLRLRNTGDVVDEYRFEAVGDVAPYVSVEPPSLRLFPGTTGVVELTFAPPRTPDATAGPHPYGVRVLPTENLEATTVAEGNITFTTFTEIRAELVPQTVKGRFRGRPRLAVDNLGNTVLTASIAGGDTASDDLSYELVPANVQIQPGRAAFVDATLKPRQITWVGSKQDRPYELAVRRAGFEPLKVNGTFTQRGLLPLWMMTTLSLLLALTITGLVLWFTYKAPVRTLATPKTEQAAATALPEEPPEQPREKPKQEPEPAQEPEAPSGGGEEPEEEQPKRTVLPLTSQDEPNLFVEFAQVRLEVGAGGCQLTEPHTTGKLDTATEEALKCFQQSNDTKYGHFSTLVETDGLGNLGRSTMTALIAAHFVDTKAVPLNLDEASPEVPWVRNMLLWSTQAEIDNGDLQVATDATRANIAYLRQQGQHAEKPTPGLISRIKEYQGILSEDRNGQIDELTLNKLKAGWIKAQDETGTVTAEDWLPAPTQ